MISAIILVEDELPRPGELEGIMSALTAATVHDVVLMLAIEAKDACGSLDGWRGGKCIVVEPGTARSLHSIAQAFAMLDQNELHGAIVCPIAFSALSQEIVVDLLQGYWKSRKNIILPLATETRDVPVIIDKTIIEEFRDNGTQTTIEELMSLRSGDILQIAVRIESTGTHE